MSSGPASPGPRRRRWSRAALALLIGLGIGPFLAEGVFRFLLFSDSGLARRFSTELRDPALYCDGGSDSDYFKLRRRWTAPEERDSFVNTDPVLGWLKSDIRGPDYSHVAERWIGERRPILMFGDSFVACVTPRRDCWEGLISRSPLNRDLAVVNYGTCAFGLDQSFLLMRESIDRWVERAPLVILGIFIEEDLDRCLLDSRGCPKPICSVVNGELAVDYPGEFELDEWAEEHPPRIRSYVLRYLVRTTPWLPQSWAPVRGEAPVLIERKKEISRAILEATREELVSRRLEYFVVLFHSPRTLQGKWGGAWRVTFLEETLDTLGMPWVSSKRALLEDHEETGRGPADYFITTPEDEGHYTAAGQEAVLPAILRGLRGEYDGAVR